MDKAVNHYSLLNVIINYGHAKKVIKLARQSGLQGATVLLARGTVKARLLKYLGLDDVRKEVVIMAADNETVASACQLLNSEFKFEKPNHGIMFTIPLCSLAGGINQEQVEAGKNRGVESMYKAITVIVDRGRAEDVIDSALKAGSKGGTIINARGSGIHQTSKLFNMEIEPEKEIVLIIAEKEKCAAIVSSISSDLEIEKPGNGIIFTQDVADAHGLA